MKRLISILIILLAMPLGASAQWWLFPGSPQAKEDTAKVQKDSVLKPKETVAKQKDSVAKTPAVVPQVSPEADAAARVAAEAAAAAAAIAGTAVSDAAANAAAVNAMADTVVLPPAPADEFVLDLPEVIDVSLLLPLKSTSKPSSNFFEYYCGVLMAVRDLGLRGVKVNLNVYDTDDVANRISDDALRASDVIIGPVKTAEIEKLLARCPEGKFVVSPMEPKAAGLADSLRVIQAPAPWSTQIDDLIEWVRAECNPGDAVVLLKDNSADKFTEQTEYLLNKLDESGMDYRTIYSTTFDDVRTRGVIRLLVASDRDIFNCSAINSIGAMGYKNPGKVALYSTSRIRSLEGVSSSSLYNAETRMTATYYIDYDSNLIKDFVLAYRALYKNEPASFAFSGYDTAYYFISMCAQYGRQWYKKLPENPGSGLQTDFMFGRTDAKGLVNTAVRRIRYDRNLTNSIVHQ